MAEQQPIRIASVDFDGVVFGGRIPAQMAVFKWAFAPHNYNRPFHPKLDEPPEEHSPREMVTAKQHRDALNHGKRKVKDGIKDFLFSLRAEGFDSIIGNTGRHNDLEMVSATKVRLEEAEIQDLFDDIHFKPDGISSDESKYWFFRALKENGHSFRHYDDNAHFIKQMAPIFPNDEFVIVQDLTSGILFSRTEMEKYPNVKREAIPGKRIKI